MSKSLLILKPLILLYLLNFSLIILTPYLIDIDQLFLLSLDEELVNLYHEKNNTNLYWGRKIIYPIVFFIQLIIKASVISFSIYTGLILFTVIKGTKSLGIIFTPVCIAEFIFVIEKAINLVVFMAKPDLTLEFIQQFSPVSLYDLLGQEIGVDYLNYFLR